MIDFAYKEIAKIIELADYEIERIDKRKRSLTTLQTGVEGEMPAFIRNEEETPEDVRVRKERDLLIALRDKLDNELGKVVFKFGAEDKKNNDFNKGV